MAKAGAKGGAGSGARGRSAFSSTISAAVYREHRHQRDVKPDKIRLCYHVPSGTKMEDTGSALTIHLLNYNH